MCIVLCVCVYACGMHTHHIVYNVSVHSAVCVLDHTKKNMPVCVLLSAASLHWCCRGGQRCLSQCPRANQTHFYESLCITLPILLRTHHHRHLHPPSPLFCSIHKNSPLPRHSHRSPTRETTHTHTHVTCNRTHTINTCITITHTDLCMWTFKPHIQICTVFFPHSLLMNRNKCSISTSNSLLLESLGVS